ncbi:MBL fold metallo-hydrolase [Streptomyces mirabilis]|uniref:MBL fold metallo-hydrolase n=1 Tax=Streptomyces mirabilis TaxID=68239 RepID=UPI003D9DBA7E
MDAGLGVADGDLGAAVSNSGALLDTLTALGHEPQDVEALVFTHLHTDHTGWGFVRDADGKLAKAFPKARYRVTEAEWATYGRDDIDLGAPSRTDSIEPLAAVRTAIDDGEEVFPGVRALVTPGHPEWPLRRDVPFTPRFFLITRFRDRARIGCGSPSHASGAQEARCVSGRAGTDSRIRSGRPIPVTPLGLGPVVGTREGSRRPSLTGGIRTCPLAMGPPKKYRG